MFHVSFKCVCELIVDIPNIDGSIPRYVIDDVSVTSFDGGGWGVGVSQFSSDVVDGFRDGGGLGSGVSAGIVQSSSDVVEEFDVGGGL